MDSFLQEQGSTGQHHEPGTFTIDSGRAWELLAAQAQPFPEAWVLKLVQAACADGCSELRVMQLADTTPFTFEGVEWNWSALSNALGRVAEGGTESLDHLATSLRWLARDVDHPFVLSLPDDHLVKWDETAFSVEQTEYATAKSPWLCVEHENSEQKASLLGRLTRKGAHFSATISTTLYHRAYTSSVPISIDGLDAVGLHHDPRFAATRDTRPLMLLSIEPESNLPAFGMSLTQDWDSAEPQEGLDIEVQGTEKAPTERTMHGAVAILAAYLAEARVARGYFNNQRDHKRRLPQSRSSYLLWVQDGAVISEEELPLSTSIGFGLAVSAEGLRTDLSGFGLVQDQAFSERRETALERLHDQLIALCDSDISFEVGRQGRFHYKSQVVQAVLGILVFFPVGVYLGANARRISQQDASLEMEMEALFRGSLEDLRVRVGGLTEPRHR